MYIGRCNHAKQISLPETLFIRNGTRNNGKVTKSGQYLQVFKTSDVGEFGMKTVSVEFYNRWGQIVYTWNGTDKSWSGVDISGEVVAEGVYFYALVAEGEDGHYYDKKGSVTLLK